LKEKSENFPMVAKTISGLEEILAHELKELGAIDVEVLKRAVSFKGDQGFLYKANLWCRTALRILKPITTFEAEDNESLYDGIKNIKWEDFISNENTIAVDAVVSDSFFRHSQFVAQKTKDAIVDRFREKTGKRPSVNLDHPDLKVNIRIHKNECTVSLDSSGQSLHKRGYRLNAVEAPLSEVLAAGLILLSGWDKRSNFIDAMCGSGTILIEAALIAFNIPPGYYRKEFGFEKWKDFDQDLWEMIYNASLTKQTEFEHRIIGSDISSRNLKIAMENLKFAKFHKDIELEEKPFDKSFAPEGRGTLIMNPPYGERLQEDDIIAFYKSIGDTLKSNYQNYSAWIISSDLQALKFIGLKPTRNIHIFNGPLECKFCKFEIYAGSKKGKYMDLK
jgi:putative N6-adenine-specific DNA methylase